MEVKHLVLDDTTSGERTSVLFNSHERSELTPIITPTFTS